MKKKLQLISGIFTALLGLSVLLFVMRYQHDPEEQPAAQMEVIDTIPEPTLAFGIPIDSFHVIQAKLKRNEFLANILLPHNVDYVTIDNLAKKSKEVFDVRRMAAGKKYTILTSTDSSEKAQYFIYQPNAIDYVVYDLRDSINIYTGQK